jgi:prepilin-type processing-associated H-X9-DG protein
VVIAIIGVLVALLLPAVQAAREAARRMQCTNNIKQLALACHNYHDTFQTFPPNHIFSGVTPGSSRNTEGWGWQTLTLPFLENQPLFDVLDVSGNSFVDLLRFGNNSLPQGSPQLLKVLQTAIPSFVCPSDSNAFKPLSHQNRHFGGGIGTRAAGFGNWRPAVNNYMSSRGMRNNNQTNVNNDTHGMFMGIRSTGFQDIYDGASNTFLIGERDTFLCRSGVWIGVRNPRGNGTRGFYYNTANARVILNAPDPPFRWNSRTGCSEGFSSLHPGGANFAMADGSVRFIGETIEIRPCSLGGQRCWDRFSPGDIRYEKVYGVYHRLARRNDGFPASLP